MKKAISIFIIIIIGIGLTLNIINANDLYVAESSLWKINKRFSEIIRDPKAVPEATFKDVAHQYEKFLVRFPHSELAPAAHLYIGQLSLVKEDYSAAIERFEKVLTLYPDNRIANIQALTKISQAYSLQGDHEKALENYRKIFKKYPKTTAGLRIPLFIAKYYADLKQLDKAQQSYLDAIEYYKKIIKENPHSILEYNALNLIAICYLALKNWREAVDTFEETLLKYPDPRIINTEKMNQMVKMINVISISQLKSYDIPLSFFQKFVSRYPNHPMRPAFEKLIKNLKQLKEKKSSNDEASREQQKPSTP